MQSTGRIALVAVQLVGLLLSAVLVALTFANPTDVEARLQQFAIAKVEASANAVLSGPGEKLRGLDRAARLSNLKREFGSVAMEWEENRQPIVRAILAQAYLPGCKVNCEFWVRASELVDARIAKKISHLRIGQGTLEDFLRERYDSSVRGLLIDLRRFGLVNVVALSLMAGLVIFKGHSNWRFTAFSILVTGYAAWAAYGYVFEQNWAFAILTRDWAAPGYQAGMILVSCMFFDWLFLKGRVTNAVANAFASALPG